MPGLAACLSPEAHIAVAMSSTIADTIVVAVFGTGRTHAHLSHTLHGQALLIDAHALVTALGAVRRQTWIDGLQTKIDQSRAAGDKTMTVTDIGMG